MLFYQKKYVEKLCRKGLLEQAIKTNKRIGDFVILENEYIQKASNPDVNSQELLLELNKKKLGIMQNELRGLKIMLENLNRTIGGIRLEVKSKASKPNYEKWTTEIHRSTEKMKKVFSNNVSNLLKYAPIQEGMMDVLLSDAHRIAGNIYLQQILEDDEQDRVIMSVIEPNLLNKSDNSTSKSNSNFNGNNEMEDSGFMNDSSMANDSGMANNSNSPKRMKIDTVDEIGEIDAADFDDFISRYVK